MRDPDIGEILVQPDELKQRVRALGEAVTAEYADRDLLLIGVLKGAVFFLADLMRQISIPCEVDFMAVSSYGSATDSSGVVRILKDLDTPIEGRHVLIVEDIVDSGLTLQYLMRNLGARNPASLEVCALLTKPSRRKVELPIRFTGFEIPDRFAIGYGLDHAERYRNLPYVAALAMEEGAGAGPAGWPSPANPRGCSSVHRVDTALAMLCDISGNRPEAEPWYACPRVGLTPQGAGGAGHSP